MCISDAYERHFYPDEFNDFAARMAWAAEGRGNHNPVAVIAGTAGPEPVYITTKAGKKLEVDASASYDPDGDSLAFNWWLQKDPATESLPDLSGGDTPHVTVDIPDSFAGRTLHLVCEVHDDGDFNLVSYRRIIIAVD